MTTPADHDKRCPAAWDTSVKCDCGAADLPEALRVPLDSLHADAGYLCGRLLNGSLTQEQVVESIRRRIDAAKLAALTAQAISAEPAEHVQNPAENEHVAGDVSGNGAGLNMSTPHARITELESQLAQRFDAADMATAAAQGFRDGVASLSANAGEPTQGAFQRALSIRTAQGWKLGGDKVPVLYTDEINGEQVCRDDVWLCTTDAFTHPSPTEGMAGWTTLPGQMPEPNTPVLLDIGKKFTIRALWAEKHTVRVGTDVDDWGEYDEETDEYYCPEGWYEWNEHEEVHWAVSETPRAWRELPQPLPAAPGPADGESNG